MTSISGCTIVRNAVKLSYPLEASLLTYLPICHEVVLCYDPDSEDETEDFVHDIARRHSKVKLLPSRWNLENHKDGTEITIQSNVAAEACRGDWVLYVQADEAIHEGDHAAILEAVENRECNGALFDRHSFLWSLDREIPEYFARHLLRLYRNGKGAVVGDGMTCKLSQGVPPTVPRHRFRMYNYSRMGSRDEILTRARYRDNFHHDTTAAIEENLKLEFKQSVSHFDPSDHPLEIQRHYLASREEVLRRDQPTQTPMTGPPSAPFRKGPVTLALLIGRNERENLAPFLWQFRGWPGDIVVFDDLTNETDQRILRDLMVRLLKLGENRYTIIRSPLNGDFGAARTLLQDAARSPWVLVTAPDERWDAELVRGLPQLVAQLQQDGKTICGFPRANFVDGVLVNDIPDMDWTDEGLARSSPNMTWPPRNLDIQYRLVRKEERWLGRIHEQPAGLSLQPDRVVSLRDHFILHNKTLTRQRAQDALYRSLGQTRGMPQVPITSAVTSNGSANRNLLEAGRPVRGKA